MKYTNTRRAALGATAILILGLIIFFRNGGLPKTSTDYMLMGAAFVLVGLNLGMSYYFDLQNHQRAQKK